ncbi:MAG: P-loop NTPase [Methanomicrobiales archaeon]|nr:P-loop NTPase [Methanomicrobiales archaeon]MDD1657629.1 P-loop NTPase [Methanomicrobiales archaeon]
MKVAVSGKGGVGKTLVAGALAWSFARKGIRTIAIDADSSPNLGLTLGLSPGQVESIIPLSEREDLIESRTRTDYPGVYRLHFTVDDLIEAHALSTPSGPFLLVMGTVRAPGAGCACPAHAVVRNLLRSLVVERNEAVVVDMEAGVEHLGRGTAERVDAMLVVTDANLKSLQAAGRILDLARAAGIPRVMLVGNRVQGADQEESIRAFGRQRGIPVAALIPFDPAVPAAEIGGRTPLADPGSPAVSAIAGLGEALLARTVPGSVGM